MVHEILIWPDPKLREVSSPVTQFDDSLKSLANDMFETMYDAKGVGLAAPQIGILKRLVVIDTTSQDQDLKPVVLVNPRITLKEGEQEFMEGCLSVPDESAKTLRATKVAVTAQDLDGKEFTVETEGTLLAVALQHELEHLDGGLFVDHLSSLKRSLIKRKMLKLKESKAREKRRSARESIKP